MGEGKVKELPLGSLGLRLREAPSLLLLPAGCNLRWLRWH